MGWWSSAKGVLVEGYEIVLYSDGISVGLGEGDAAKGITLVTVGMETGRAIKAHDP